MPDWCLLSWLSYLGFTDRLFSCSTHTQTGTHPISAFSAALADCLLQPGSVPVPFAVLLSDKVRPTHCLKLDYFPIPPYWLGAVCAHTLTLVPVPFGLIRSQSFIQIKSDFAQSRRCS